MRSVEVAGDMYEVGSSEDGIQDRLSRYNKNRSVHISLYFAETENPILIAEIRNNLKDIFISKLGR